MATVLARQERKTVGQSSRLSWWKTVKNKLHRPKSKTSNTDVCKSRSEGERCLHCVEYPDTSSSVGEDERFEAVNLTSPDSHVYESICEFRSQPANNQSFPRRARLTPAPLDLTSISCLRAPPLPPHPTHTSLPHPALPAAGRVELERNFQHLGYNGLADVYTPTSPNSHGTDDRCSIQQQLREVARHGWYWGPVSRADAERLLSDTPNGTFLVRDSGSETAFLTLSFRIQDVTLHSRIQHSNSCGLFRFQIHRDGSGFKSVQDLVEHAVNESQLGIFCYLLGRREELPQFAVRLLNPLSRFSKTRSLQYLCRFKIRQYVRIDHIDILPVPRSMREYLKQNQFL